MSLERHFSAQHRPLCWLVQPSLRYLVLYASDDPEAVIASGPRMRPRIAGLSYSRRGFRLSFGRRVTGRTVSHGREWDDLVARLESDERFRGPGLLFREAPSGYPLVIEVSSASGVGPLGGVSD